MNCSSSPISSRASRKAASRGVSPGSIFPPGKATWPEWARKCEARNVRRTLRPSGRLTIGARTAAGCARAAGQAPALRPESVVARARRCGPLEVLNA